MSIQRIVRQGWLSPEEANEDQVIRDQIACELPELIARDREGWDVTKAARARRQQRKAHSVVNQALRVSSQRKPALKGH